MFCKYCGRDVGETTRFCPKCGREISKLYQDKDNMEEKDIAVHNEYQKETVIDATIPKTSEPGFDGNFSQVTSVKTKLTSKLYGRIGIVALLALLAFLVYDNCFNSTDTEEYMVYRTVVDTIEEEIGGFDVEVSKFKRRYIKDYNFGGSAYVARIPITINFENIGRKKFTVVTMAVSRKEGSLDRNDYACISIRFAEDSEVITSVGRTLRNEIIESSNKLNNSIFEDFGY